MGNSFTSLKVPRALYERVQKVAQSRGFTDPAEAIRTWVQMKLEEIEKAHDVGA